MATDKTKRSCRVLRAQVVLQAKADLDHGPVDSVLFGQAAAFSVGRGEWAESLEIVAIASTCIRTICPAMANAGSPTGAATVQTQVWPAASSRSGSSPGAPRKNPPGGIASGGQSIFPAPHATASCIRPIRSRQACADRGLLRGGHGMRQGMLKNVI